MGVSRAEVSEIGDAESLIRSAMLVIFVDKAELQLPTRTAFVRLVKAAKSAKATLDENRLDAFIKDAPPQFQRLARRAMQRFINNDLPQIRHAYMERSLKYLRKTCCATWKSRNR